MPEAEALYLIGVIAAFGAFIVVLFSTALWVNLEK